MYEIKLLDLSLLIEITVLLAIAYRDFKISAMFIKMKEMANKLFSEYAVDFGKNDDSSASINIQNSKEKLLKIFDKSKESNNCDDWVLTIRMLVNTLTIV